MQVIMYSRAQKVCLVRHYGSSAHLLKKDDEANLVYANVSVSARVEPMLVKQRSIRGIPKSA